MRNALSLLILTAIVAPAAAQHSPPASLSHDEVHGLMTGQGMGLARAAELNAYPGPKHVLELADSLALSDRQRETAERLMADVQTEARALGARVVEAERELSALFDGEPVNDGALEAAAHEVARLRAELRLVHLRAHLRMAEVLTAEQSARYHTLRHRIGAPMEPGSDHSSHH